jgi:hypothetical protein
MAYRIPRLTLASPLRRGVEMSKEGLGLLSLGSDPGLFLKDVWERDALVTRTGASHPRCSHQKHVGPYGRGRDVCVPVSRSTNQCHAVRISDRFHGKTASRC